MNPFQSAPDLPKASLSAPQVVLVEDDEALSDALTFALELEGFSVQAHRSAHSVSADAVPKFGCLVIDYRLPEENGLSLLTRLREAGVTLPAIVITSHVSALTRSKAGALYASIVEKPLLGDGLICAIRDALSQA